MHTGDGRAGRRARRRRCAAVVAEISAKGLGMTCVVGEDGRLAGIITDGDLRRHMALADLLAQPASAVMTAGAAAPSGGPCWRSRPSP